MRVRGQPRRLTISTSLPSKRCSNACQTMAAYEKTVSAFAKTVSVFQKTVSVFQKTVSVFPPPGIRWQAFGHPLGEDGAGLAGVRARETILKNTFHLSQGSLESLCAKAFREVTGHRGTLTSLHRAFTPLLKGCGSASVPSTQADL